MSPRVSLSLKSAQWLLEVLDGGQGIYHLGHEAAEAELKQAVAKAQRSSSVRRTLRKPKQEKRKAKALSRKEVRAAVMQRANGHCEACGDWSGRLQLDHFWGRARAESVESCWALEPLCHLAKSNNKPSAAQWLSNFTLHCTKHGYTAEAEKARKRLAFVEARGGGA